MRGSTRVNQTVLNLIQKKWKVEDSFSTNFNIAYIDIDAQP